MDEWGLLCDSLCIVKSDIFHQVMVMVGIMWANGKKGTKQKVLYSLSSVPHSYCLIYILKFNDKNLNTKQIILYKCYN